MKNLTASLKLNIRFCEIDAMQVAWHGSYVKYFEDAREHFGNEYGLSYLTIGNAGYYAPVVDLSFQFKKPIRYGMQPTITISYIPTESAKIIFEYEIVDSISMAIIATGRSVQVFVTSGYELSLENPPFFVEWKSRMGIESDRLI